MYQVFAVFLLSTSVLFSYYDSDLDGVENKHDQCPNTPLTELVDLTGCTIKNLISPHHFDVIFGQSYSKDETMNLNISQLQLGYYYKNFSLQLSGSYFDMSSSTLDDSGWNDLYLDGYYQFRLLSNLLLRFGGGMVFPTYDSSSNKTDYKFSFQSSYRKDDFSIFGGVGYTILGDESNSSTSIEYDNTYFYKLGLGHYLDKRFYSSLSYTQYKSIYSGQERIETLSVYGYWSISKHWFSTLKYKHGLSDNAMDDTLGLKLGYYW